ncbi:hypothetical protein B0H17DRAFT_916569 [Mycena rosella]|uniref:ER membrane protein complex subunit 1 n=1 Tax=Mycena rosella TaxID=1033263 RepID=A0AAD7MBC9_MYCRO|nr:hypothetical protein B0H17DRAFT_916569 [Mycena rosella]
MFLPLFGLLLCNPLVLAIHESDVGVIDWHKKLIGVPLAAPVVHHGENGSVLLVPTASNVLAALNTTDGSVAWRYLFDAADDIASLHVDGDVVVALSGQGASMLRSFEALTGLMALEKRLDAPAVPSAGVDVCFEPNTGAMFTLNTHTITRVGEVHWTWEAPDKRSVMPYSKLVHTGAALYAVGLSQQSASLHLAAIDPITGTQIQTAWKHLPPSVSSFVLAGDIAVWVDHAKESLGFIQLIPSLKASIRTEKALKWYALVDVGLQKSSLVVAVLTNGEARVLQGREDGVIESIHSFPANDGPQSLFAGGLDKDGAPYVARLWTTVSNVSFMFLLEIYTPGQEGAVKSFILLDTYKHGTVSHVCRCQLAVDGTRLVITTSTGAIQLWEQEQMVWGREEALATIDVAAFVELPLPEHVVKVGLGSESFVTRLIRQIGDAKDFPSYAAAFAQRFVTGAPPREEVVVSAHNHTASLSRDAFGFKQVLVAATAYGSVFGLDTASGAVLWTRVLGLGWAGEGVGAMVKPVKIFVLNGEGDAKDVVLIAQRKANNNLVDTVLFRIDPLTGASISPTEENTERLLQGTDVIAGPLVEAFLIPESDVIILIDEFFQVHTINPYPDTEDSAALIARLAPNLYLPFLENFSEGPRVVGHGLKLDPNLSEKHVAFRTWGLSLPPGETAKTIVKPRLGPIASLGKVLGNRTTLYKYLNPRMFVVLTQGTDAVASGCGVYVVDGAKGSVLYSAVVPRAGSEVCDVHATLTENWLVYHYYEGAGLEDGETKGWRIVTVELYEGSLDEKTRSSDMSAFAVESVNVEALEQSYLFAHGVTAITSTSTKFGITSKDIIVATQNNKIHAIPRRLLNPRRPQNRKPTAEEQQEEQLIPYDVVLPDDPRSTISHNYEVANTRNIIASPALLESTSLVFAYGLDLFLTRVAPSSTFDILNKNFNKAQLVLTVSGLALGIAIAKPMVRRKRLRERWYQ